VPAASAASSVTSATVMRSAAGGDEADCSDRPRKPDLSAA